MSKEQVLTPAVLLLVGVVVIVEGLSLPWTARGGPGPGMFPVLVGIAIAGLSLIVVIDSLASLRRAAAETSGEGQARFPAARLAYLAFIGWAYLKLLPLLGHLVLSPVLVAAIVLMMMQQRKALHVVGALAFGLLISIAVQGLFGAALKVPLPTGLLWANRL